MPGILSTAMTSGNLLANFFLYSSSLCAPRFRGQFSGTIVGTGNVYTSAEFFIIWSTVTRSAPSTLKAVRYWSFNAISTCRLLCKKLAATGKGFAPLGMAGTKYSMLGNCTPLSGALAAL